jgi:hypothetical protein
LNESSDLTLTKISRHKHRHLGWPLQTLQNLFLAHKNSLNLLNQCKISTNKSLKIDNMISSYLTLNSCSCIFIELINLIVFNNINWIWSCLVNPIKLLKVGLHQPFFETKMQLQLIIARVRQWSHINCFTDTIRKLLLFHWVE